MLGDKASMGPIIFVSYSLLNERVQRQPGNYQKILTKFVGENKEVCNHNKIPVQLIFNWD